MNLALHQMGGDTWPAGRVVLELLIQALRRANRQTPSIYLTVWDNQAPAALQELTHLADGLIRLPGSDPNPQALTEVLQAAHVDVFFSLPTESALRIRLPRLTWFYDFQHLHLPENFPAAEREKRTDLFRRNAETATRILLYSEAVRRDLEQFAPGTGARVRVLRFVPHIPDAVLARSPVETLRRLRLPERFFFLPNQIHRYKNHRLVVDALALLAHKGLRPAVVCTGTAPDAAELQALQELIRERNQQAQWFWMGLVARDDYYQLLRACVGLVNPSLFEGFGLSAAEVACFGKPALLSDLPVFREPARVNALFFDPHDAGQLAGQMTQTWTADAVNGEESAALAAWRIAQEQFGRDLGALFTDTLNAGANP